MEHTTWVYVHYFIPLSYEPLKANKNIYSHFIDLKLRHREMKSFVQSHITDLKKQSWNFHLCAFFLRRLPESAPTKWGSKFKNAMTRDRENGLPRRKIRRGPRICDQEGNQSSKKIKLLELFYSFGLQFGIEVVIRTQKPE